METNNPLIPKEEANVWSIWQPVYVGSWNIGVGYFPNGTKYVSLKLMITKKPNFIHRWFNKLLLGWEWENASSK